MGNQHVLISQGVKRSNAEHARGNHFWPPARPFPAQNFKGKHKEQLLSRKLSERSCKKETKVGKRENSRIFEPKVIIVPSILLIYHSILRLTQKSSKTPWLLWLFAIRARLFGFDSLKACHVDVTTFALAQTFDRGVPPRGSKARLE